MRSVWIGIIGVLLQVSVGATVHKVPFEMVNGLIVLQASVDNQMGNYILDTGSDEILINGSIDDNAKQIAFETTVGSLVANITTSSSIMVGAYMALDKEVYITNLKSVESFLGITLSGILGGEVFTPHKIEIDYRNKTIAIATNAEESFDLDGLNSVKLFEKQGILLCQTKINQNTKTFILDSGATSHYLDVSTYLEATHDFDLTDEIVEVTTASESNVNRSVVNAKNMTISKSAISHSRFIISDFSTLSDALGTHIDGLLSMHKLTDQRMVIDFKRNVLYR